MYGDDVERPINRKYHGRFGIISSATLKQTRSDNILLGRASHLITKYQASSYISRKGSYTSYFPPDDNDLSLYVPYSINKQARWTLLSSLESEFLSVTNGCVSDYQPFAVHKSTVHWHKKHHLLLKPIEPHNNPNDYNTETNTPNRPTKKSRDYKNRKGNFQKTSPARRVHEKKISHWKEAYTDGILNHVYIVDLPSVKKYPTYRYNDNFTCGCYFCDGRRPKNGKKKNRRQLGNELKRPDTTYPYLRQKKKPRKKYLGNLTSLTTQEANQHTK